MAATSLSVALTIAIGLAGPSAMVPPLPGPSWQPPYSLGLDPGAHLIIGLAGLAIVLGAVGLAAGLSALRRGWVPDGRLLLLAGCLAVAVLAFLPPSGSSDHLNYAAYGRIAALGHDPYVVTPRDLPGDPVARVVEEWRDTPSVYGPVATAVQALASIVAGDSVRLTVFVMAVVNAAAYIGVALLLHRSTRSDRARRARAALLWTVNPLVIYHLAAGMHVDTLAIVCVIAALVVGGAAVGGPAIRRVGAGLLLGLGVAVKVTVGLVALGPAWELRRSPRKLALVAGAALVVAIAAYGLAGPHALDQVSQASRSVSLATPWSLVKGWLQAIFGSGGYRSWIQIGSLVLLAGLAWLLIRALREPYGILGPTGSAPGVAVILVTAWLFATPYALPWYDGLVFALLALVPVTALDGFVTARLTVLSLAYLPAREMGRPADLDWLVTVIRSKVAPWALLTLIVALAWWAWRAGRDRRAGAPAQTPPASAARRP